VRIARILHVRKGLRDHGAAGGKPESLVHGRPGPRTAGGPGGTPRFLLLSVINGSLQKIMEGLRAHRTLIIRQEKRFQDLFLQALPQ
jgi:hypothetical protein